MPNDTTRTDRKHNQLISLRLSEGTLEELDDLAEEIGSSRSELIRAGVDHILERSNGGIAR